MNKRRLLKLADLLVKDARTKKGIRFSMDVVIARKNPEAGAVKMDCGTTGCAMGLAAVSGAFKRAGLSCKTDFRNPDSVGWGCRQLR